MYAVNCQVIGYHKIPILCVCLYVLMCIEGNILNMCSSYYRLFRPYVVSKKYGKQARPDQRKKTSLIPSFCYRFLRLKCITEMLHRLVNTGRECNMEFNIDKSQVMRVSTRS